jgi:predicted homoserine dehydrogenase-like protein
LIEHGSVTQPIRRGELLTYRNCAVDGASAIVALRRRQDEMVQGASAVAA